MENDFADGEGIIVGSMHISIMSLPGLSSPDGRACLVVDDIFDAQLVVELQSRREETSRRPCHDWDNSERYRRTWSWVQKILSLSGRARNCPSSGNTATNERKTSDTPIRPFSTIQEWTPGRLPTRSWRSILWLCWGASRGFGGKSTERITLRRSLFRQRHVKRLQLQSARRS